MTPVAKHRSLHRGRVGLCPTNVSGVGSHSPGLLSRKTRLSFQANEQGGISPCHPIPDKSYTLNNGVTIPAIGECLVTLIIKHTPDGTTCR